VTPGTRIILNTLATYGRSVCAMLLGLFSARWVLAALGSENFGIYGVVGTLITVVSLLNGIMSGSVSRYYAYAIGETRDGETEGGLECLRRWFNAAILIHAVLPVMLIIVGYPLGIYALRHWMNIPDARIPAAVAAFRLALCASFVNMVSVPYIAMYQAKQLIAELSVWSLLTTIITFSCAYCLLSYQGDCLVAYAAYMTLVPVVIQLIQVFRAHRKFKACRICGCYLLDWRAIRQLFVFAFGEFFGWLGGAIRDNGMTVLINVKLGLEVNAAYTVANQVSAHTTSLSSAMIGALMPAVTTAEGSGDHERACRLSFLSIKFGVLLILLFCIPLILEIDTVLSLWLVNPPAHTATLCKCVLLALVCHKLGWGHHLAILAKGRVVAYQTTVGVTSALGLVLAWALISSGLGVFGVGVSLVVIFAIMTIERVIAAQKICGMPVSHWLRGIVAPLSITAISAYGAGLVVCNAMPPLFYRIVLTTVLSSVALVLLSWLVVFSSDERRMLRAVLQRIQFALPRHF